MFQDLQDGGPRGLLPDDLTEAIAAGQAELMRVEKLQDEASRSEAQEGRKHEIKTLLDLALGLFVHLATGIAYQTGRQRQGEVASLCLVEQSCGPAGFDGRRFQLSSLPFEAKQQAPMG